MEMPFRKYFPHININNNMYKGYYSTNGNIKFKRITFSIRFVEINKNFYIRTWCPRFQTYRNFEKQMVLNV